MHPFGYPSGPPPMNYGYNPMVGRPLIMRPPMPGGHMRGPIPRGMRPVILPMRTVVTRPPTPIKAPPPRIAPSTIYVGRIPTGIDETFMRKILELCGTVGGWKQVKSFGFCDFLGAQHALRALHVLKLVSIRGQMLVVLNISHTVIGI